MKKSAFTIIEVIIVFCLILAVIFWAVPKSLDSTQQANFISKWRNVYSEMIYMFSVIKAQEADNLNNKLSSSDTNKVDIIVESIKPYLRITKEVDNARYKPHYMNKKKIAEEELYYVDRFYHAQGNLIIGIKWFDNECIDDKLCGFMSFDINGAKLPNNWGRDIFGINIFKDKTEPIGKKLPESILQTDCSKFGHGVSCSYYYLIGGEFE